MVSFSLNFRVRVKLRARFMVRFSLVRFRVGLG